MLLFRFLTAYSYGVLALIFPALLALAALAVVMMLPGTW